MKSNAVAVPLVLCLLMPLSACAAMDSQRSASSEAQAAAEAGCSEQIVETEIAWPLTLSRARMLIGVALPIVPCVSM